MVQDVDICLNISTTNSSLQIDDSFKSAFKKLAEQPRGDKITNTVTNKLNERNVVNKRVKQKSLSAIVARKLNKANADGQTESVQKQLKPLIENKSIKTNQKSIELSAKLNNHDVQSNNSLSHENNNISSEHIAFTNVVKENNVGKSVVARKRNKSDEKPKKSLTDIFSKKPSFKTTELDVLNSSEKYNLSGSNTLDDSAEQVKTFSAPDTEQLNIETKTKKRNKDVRKKTKPNNAPLYDKAKGKFSSLFGNNPEIPNIGQRLIKPINEVVFTGANFSDFDIHPFTVSNLEQNMHITKMTSVQQKAIPQIFSGNDILVRSQTGSGKTLAYSIPIVERLHKLRPKLNRNSGIRALVVVPTRELALQTYECFLKLIKPFTWIVPGYLVGGEKRKAEKARLRKGCNILVATPGRLLDHIKHTFSLKLNEVNCFVLDEADRMLDMGYEKDISAIVSVLKVSCSETTDSEYNPIEMLKQNTRPNKKIIFTDEETTLEDEKISNEGSNLNTEKNEQATLDISDNEEKKQQSYYNSDSDTHDDDFPIKSKKQQKKKLFPESTVKKKESVSHIKGNQGNKQHDTTTDSSKRQTILLSATLTKAVEKLAGLTMQNPIFIDAAKENLESTNTDMTELNEDLIVPQSVTQTYIVTPPKLRMVSLAAYITGRCQSSGEHKILIFMATQDMVDYYMDILSSVLTKPTDENDEDSDPLVDVEFFKLHGNMSQKERTEVFKTFRQTKSGVLLCTDVAARGLDMPKVDCVVQYTGPLSARDYVHRIGRTARAGSSGLATIFLTPPEIEFVRMLESRRIRIRQEDMNNILDKLLHPLSQHNTPQAAAIALQHEFEILVMEDQKLREKAYRAYTSWIRFYSSYPREMREIFNRRTLHLGHYAKSFALRDPPQRIGGIVKSLREKDAGKPQHNNKLSNERTDTAEQQKKQQQERRGQNAGGMSTAGMLKRVRMLNVSEYDSGLEPAKKPKKSPA